MNDDRDQVRNKEMMSQKPLMAMQVDNQAGSDPVYGSNGRGYWLGHSKEHISKEEVFNRYLDTLKPREQVPDPEIDQSEASLKQAQDMNVPKKF